MDYIDQLMRHLGSRDLYGVYMAMKSGTLDAVAAIECYKKYMSLSNIRIPTTGEYAKNLDEKIQDSNFHGDIMPFPARDAIYSPYEAYSIVQE
jgi:hypothetical protein